MIRLALIPLLITAMWPFEITAAPVARRKLYVDNTSGSTVSVIDLDSRSVIHEIPVGLHPHGLAASPDQKRVFVSVESDNSIKVVDSATDSILNSIPTSGRPNQIAITRDGKWLYAAINDRGTADVIDVEQGKVVKSLDVGASPHNCYSHSPRYMYVSAINGKLVRQFDYTRDHEAVRTVTFDLPVRPLCITRDDKRLFVALYNLHGFAWADLTTGQVAGREERPLPPPEKRSKFAYMNTHGLDLRPGDRELWVTSFIGNGLMIYDITGASPRYITTVAVGDAPNWLTFSPNGRFAYSANAGDSSITIVDCEKRERIADVKVGPVPKRLLEVHPPVAGL